MSAPTLPGGSSSDRLAVVVANWRDRGHPDAGGAEVYAERLAEELAAYGHRVTFLSAAYPSAAPEPDSPVEHVRGGGRWTVYPWVAWWLVRHRRTVDVVVDCQNGIPFFSPLWVHRRAAVVCVVHHVHTAQFGLHFPAPVATVGRWLEGPVSARVYGRRPAVAVSPSTAQALRARLRWRGPIHIVPNGAPDAEAAPAHGRARDARPTVVSVGRLVVHKRVRLLVEAAGQLADRRPDLRVEIIGTGPELPVLRALVSELGLGEVVRLRGRLDDEQVRAVLDRSWLSVATTRGEGWGLSVLEAAARGVPTVAFDVEGLRDAVRADHTGWLVPEGDDLADALDTALHVLAGPDAVGEMDAACRAWASEFTWSGSGDRLMSVVEAEVVRRSRAAPDRRSTGDEATLVELAPDEAERLPALRRKLRVTDRAGGWESRAWILLTACPQAQAEQVLARLGSDAGVGIGLATVRAATSEDLLRAVPLRGSRAPR